MNIATVFKQTTTTSAGRMTTSRIHHRTELSTLSSINFDNLKRKNLSGQLPQTKSCVLMESNSVLNVVQELGNEHRHHHRRNSLSLTDERLLKILSAPPDEPLYINDKANNKTTLNGDINKSSGDNLLIQYEAATSSIVTVDDYENLPPADKCAVATNIEGYTQFFFFIIIVFVFSLYFFYFSLFCFASYAVYGTFYFTLSLNQKCEIRNIAVYSKLLSYTQYLLASC